MSDATFIRRCKILGAIAALTIAFIIIGFFNSAFLNVAAGLALMGLVGSVIFLHELQK